MRSLHIALLLLGAGVQAAAQDHPARLVDPSPAPVWPEVLRAAGIFGGADVQLVVRGDGSVDPQSIRVLNAAHPGLRNAAIRTVQRWRYEGAVAGGRPAADTLIVRFVVSRAIDLPPLTDSLVTTGPVALNDSTWSVLFVTPRPSAAPVPLSSAVRDTIARAAVRGFLAIVVAGDTTATNTVCIWMRQDTVFGLFTKEDYAALARRDVVVAPPERCPPTHFGMAYVIGQDRIAGADPLHVIVGRVMPWGDESWWVELATARSAAGGEWRCGVWRTGGGFTARCTQTGRWVA